MNRIMYISGKVSGLHKDVWKMNFDTLEKQIRKEYPKALVINPIYIKPHNGEEDWFGYMRSDVSALCKCTDIFVMNNWWSSKGAIVELVIAKILGIKIHWRRI